MSKPYVVKRGDTLSGIARQHGYKSWHEIYDSPENSAFRAKRPNPNLIFPGDVLLLPSSPTPSPQPCDEVGATLRRGDRGEEVRRLQHNLNEALQHRFGLLSEDGIFGGDTEQAVRIFQQLFRLHSVDGIVGPETRTALATRVLCITGQITRTPDAPKTPGNPVQPPSPPKPPAPPPADVQSQDSSSPSSDDNKSAWLVQGQPGFIWTPPPWAFYDPKNGPKPDYSVYSGALALGIVYQTSKEGPNWQFGGAGQFQFNSRKQPSDPRYTLQLQGQVTYADPFSVGRFHTAILGQVAGSYNMKPNFWTLGVGLGGQVSVDIIKDRWNLFAQGVVTGQWTLNGPDRGQFLLFPQVTIGSTIQWEIGGN